MNNLNIKFYQLKIYSHYIFYSYIKAVSTRIITLF